MKKLKRLIFFGFATLPIVISLSFRVPRLPDVPSCHAAVEVRDEATVNVLRPKRMQDRPKPKEGEEPSNNPDHDGNKADCATKPNPKTGMISCECHKWEKCDGSERKSCSNFCFKSKCRCVNPCV